LEKGPKSSAELLEVLLKNEIPAEIAKPLIERFTEVELINDQAYAQDLAEIAMKLVSYPPHNCMEEIAAMSRHAQHMLATSLIALTELDPFAGPKVKQLDDTVDTAYERLYKVLAYQRDIKGVVEPILLLALVIRHLERMADHATNIAQRVSYIVTGYRG
jgi:phosphate transport system protein